MLSMILSNLKLSEFQCIDMKMHPSLTFITLKAVYSVYYMKAYHGKKGEGRS